MWTKKDWEKEKLALRAGVMAPRTLEQFEHAFCPQRFDSDDEREVIPLFESEPDKRAKLVNHFNSQESYHNRLAMLPPKRLNTDWLMETLHLKTLVEEAVIDEKKRDRRNQGGGFFKALITEEEVAEAQRELGYLVAQAVERGEEEKMMKRLREAQDHSFSLIPKKKCGAQKSKEDQANPPQQRQVYLAIVFHVQKEGRLPTSKELSSQKPPGLFATYGWAADPKDNAPTVAKSIGFSPLPRS